MTMAIGMCMPLVTLPQFYDVWVNQQSKGVSLLTWTFFTIQAGIFGLFAIRHRERPLVITYIPLFFIELGIVIGLLYHH